MKMRKLRVYIIRLERDLQFLIYVFGRPIESVEWPGANVAFHIRSMKGTACKSILKFV
jgi:hypothetical protein